MKAIGCPKCGTAHLIVLVEPDEYKIDCITGFRCTAPKCRHEWSVNDRAPVGEVVA